MSDPQASRPLSGLERIQQLEADPRFAKLDYAAQQRVRVKAAHGALSVDPRFMALPDDAKERVITKIASRPPIFENPDVGKFVEGVKSKGLGGTAAAGNRGLYAQMPLYQLGMQLGNTLMRAMGNTQGAAFGQAQYDFMYGRDGKKAQEYMDSQPGSASATAETLGNIAGFFSNFGVMKTLPTVKAAETAARAGVGMLAAGTAIRSQVLRNVLGNLAENTVEAVGLTASDILKQSLDGNKDVFNARNVAEVYGRNALIDYAIGTAAGVVWPFAKLTGRALKSSFLPGKVDPRGLITQDTLGNIIEEASTGKLPPEMAARLPVWYSDHTRALEYVNGVRKDIGPDSALLKESPAWRTSVQARFIGEELGMTPEGLLTMRKVDDMVAMKDKAKYFKTFTEAEDYTVSRLEELTRTKPKDFPIDGYGPVLQGAILRRRAINETYNALPTPAGFTKPAALESLTELDGSALLSAQPGKALLVTSEARWGGHKLYKPSEGGTHILIPGKVAPPSEALSARTAAEVLKKQNPALRETVEELTIDALRRAGYDSVNTPSGHLLPLSEMNLKPIREKLPKVSLGKPTSELGDFGGDAFVRAETEKLYKDSEIARDPKKAALYLSGRGELTPERVRLFTQNVLSDSGKKATVEVNLGEKNFLSQWNPEKSVLSITLPKDTLVNRRQIIKGIVKALKEGDLAKKDILKFTTPAVRKLKPFLIPGTSYSEKVSWVQSNLKKLGGGGAEILPDGKVVWKGRTFSSVEELADTLLMRRLGPETLKVALAQDGFRLVGSKGAYSILDPSGKAVVSGASVEELTAKTDWRPSKIPVEFMPEVAVVEGGLKITYDNNIIKGNLTEVVNHLDRYMNYRLEAAKKVLEKTPEAMKLSIPNRKWEVVIPSAGIRETFSSPQEASWYLRGGWAQYEGVKRIVGRKGLDLSIRDGKYTLYVDGRLHEAPIGDKNALAKLLKQVPDPQTSPALLGEEVETMLSEKGITLPPQGGLYSPANPPPFTRGGKNLTPFEKMRRISPILGTPQGTYIMNSLAKTGNRDISKKFASLGDGVRTFNREHSKWREISRAAVSPGGKTIPASKRKGIRWYLEAKTEASREALIKEFKLTEEDLGIAKNIRKVFGETEGEGLFALFGIDPWKYQQEYVPHVRKSIQELQAKGIDLTPENIFAQAFPRGIPKEFKFFHEMDRLSDVINYDAEDDIALLLDRYITQGLRKHYLNPLWRDFDSSFKQAISAGAVDPTTRKAVMEWRETLMGYRTPDEKAVEDVMVSFSERLGGKGPLAGIVKDFSRVLFTLQTFTTQAWKPWNVARNMTQVYTILGGAYGMGYAFDAMKKVARNADEVIARGKTLGVLMDTPPLINSIIDAESLPGRLVHKGLAAFKSSDDITRAVAYVAGDTIFDEGIAKLKGGVLKSPQDFVNYTKLYLAEDANQALVLDLINKGQIPAAKDLYSKMVVENTMFSYDKINQPVAMRGFYGRLFGQFQVYSIQYVEMLRKGLTKGPLADRVVFATRFAAVSLALNAGLNSAGIAADRDFLPWSPAQFTGGPMWNLALDLLEATGQGYQADQARERISRTVPFDFEKGTFRFPTGTGATLVPGASHLKMLERWYNYNRDGEYWLAWLALTNTPIRDDLRKY